MKNAVRENFFAASDPASEHVLALHGFTGSGDDFELARTFLSEKFSANFDAPAIPPLALPQTLAFLRERWEKLAAPRTLLGYSMGGRIALHLALTENFWRANDRLVLVSASPGIASEKERAARRRADEALADEIDAAVSAENFYARWIKNPIVATQAHMPQPWRNRLRERRARADKSVWAAHLRLLGTGALPSLWEKIPALAAPETLFLVGETDAKFRAIAEKMHAAIPCSRIVVIPASGHSPHLENARAFVEAVFGGF